MGGGIQRPGTQRPIQVIGMTSTVVALCECGSNRPLILPGIPGAGGGAQCGECGVIWTIRRIEYEEPMPDKDGKMPEGATTQLNIKLHALVPKSVLHVPSKGGIKIPD